MPRRNAEDESSEREMRGALKDAVRPNAGETHVEFCRRLVAVQRFGAWDDGNGEMLIDTFSASGLVAVHDGLSELARPKLMAMSMQRAVDISFRLINKANSK